MEHEHEVEVRIISKETVKPSLPPSTHPQNFSLALLDQIFPVIHLPVLLFYTAQEINITSLKSSLSQTLDKFYPLAGRFLDESTISCNNQGIPFIETKVNCHLSAILTSPHKLKFLTKFLPPLELQAVGPRAISELVPLAFQFNVFQCGGVVIGCYMFHKLLDIASLATFLKHWAALASKRYKDIVQPDFEATIKAFPPLPKVEQALKIELPSADEEFLPINVVVKSFIFSAVTLNNLKAIAATELVPKPTRFEAVVGFIWDQILSTKNFEPEVVHTLLSFTVNMRPRMNPPLPKESMGNFLTNVKAQAHKSSRVQDLVKEIHSSLSEINQKITTVYQGENRAKAFLSEWKAEAQAGAMKYREGLFRLTSWCNMGLHEADFGFGEPVWVVPADGVQPPHVLRNFIFLTDHKHPITGYGIEAWLYLEENEMQRLMSNPHFLAFACSN